MGPRRLMERSGIPLLVGLLLTVGGIAAARPDVLNVANVHAAQDTTPAQSAGSVDFDYSKVFVPLDELGPVRFSGYAYGPLQIQGAGATASLPDISGTAASPACQTFTAAVKEAGTRSVSASFHVDATNPVSGSAVVAQVFAVVLDQKTQAQAGFADQWHACLAELAVPGSAPLDATLAGKPAVYFTAAQGSGLARHFVDVVAWLEPGVEILVTAPSLEGSDLVKALTDPHEPALEIARALISRNDDPTRVLVDQAFAPVGGLTYGQPVPGIQDAVMHAYRVGLQQETTAGTTAGATPGAATGPSSTTIPITRVEDRPLFAGTTLRAEVQVVVWDPAFLNTNSFRKQWLDGIQQAAGGAVTTPSRPGARSFALATVDGQPEAQWISDCYTVKVAGASATDVQGLATTILSAQRAAEQPLLATASAAESSTTSSTEAQSPEAATDARNVDMCSARNLALLLRATESAE